VVAGGDESGRLYLSAKLGLTAIYAYGGISTPEGIHLGSTIEKGAVAELDIQLTKQDCYE
jgi:hypothetical protein